MIYGQQDFFFLATWWVGYFFTAVQEFFSITFVLHAIFFFRQALAGNFFLNGRPLRSRLLCGRQFELTKEKQNERTQRKKLMFSGVFYS